MKFGEFFKKYTLATLIYTLISGVLSIAAFAAFYHVGKKQDEEIADDISKAIKEPESDKE